MSVSAADAKVALLKAQTRKKQTMPRFFKFEETAGKTGERLDSEVDEDQVVQGKSPKEEEKTAAIP